MIAESPTPPHPCTAICSPVASRLRAMMARYAVANLHPSEAASTKPSESGSRMRLSSASSIATYSANDPQCVKPGCDWLSQTCSLPERHSSQRPHAQMKGAVTRSPMAQPESAPTSAPSSAISPANS